MYTLFFYFIDVTLQILQQAEDQLVNATSSQPSNKRMEKRAIPDFGNPSLMHVHLETFKGSLP